MVHINYNILNTPNEFDENNDTQLNKIVLPSYKNSENSKDCNNNVYKYDGKRKAPRKYITKYNNNGKVNYKNSKNLILGKINDKHDCNNSNIFFQVHINTIFKIMIYVLTLELFGENISGKYGHVSVPVR